MKLFILLSLVSVALAGQNIVNLANGSPKLMLGLFSEYQNSMDRHYPAVEARMRLSLFRKYVADTAAWNEADPEVEYGLTIFADLTDAEAANMHGLNASMPEAPVQEDGPPAAGLGTNHKSRYGPVKNQGQTNACWAFAATCVLEGHAALNSGRYTSLSEQETADCTSGSTIARGGYHNEALKAIQRQNHLATLSTYPFVSRDGRCSTRQRNALPFSISGVYRVNGDNGLASALNGGPVAAGMAFDRRVGAYRGGIYTDRSCMSSRPNHAITVIGYASNYWEIRNSYGSRGWGEAGYGRFTRSVNNMCNISQYSFYIRTRRAGVEQEE